MLASSPRFASFFAACVLSVAAHAGAPVGTVFTYQGSLVSSGVKYSGAADMRFRLWTLSGAGSTVGPLLTFDGAGSNPPPVNVTNGLFTVQLDFGVVFNGEERWLELEVRTPAGSGSYSTLSPRQLLSATPYALYALNASSTSGLALPFSASVSSASPLFALTNTGAGGAGQFFKSGGAAPALKAATTGVNNALWVLNTGGAPIASIPATSEDAAVSAWNLGAGTGVIALNGGTGLALRASVENTTSVATAALINTTGTGSALRAGILNTTSGADTANIGTAGVGTSLRVESPNAANPSSVVVSMANGTGPALQADIVNSSSSAAAVLATSVGTGPGGAFANGNPAPMPALDGVVGQSIATIRLSAGVHAVGNGPAINAAALHVERGAVNVSGPLPERASGTITVPAVGWAGIFTCPGGAPTHTHQAGWENNVPLLNTLIIGPGVLNASSSMIIATVETVPPPPLRTVYTVSVHSKVGGACTFRVGRIGDPGGCPVPIETVYVHYMIINPQP